MYTIFLVVCTWTECIKEGMILEGCANCSRLSSGIRFFSCSNRLFLGVRSCSYTSNKVRDFYPQMGCSLFLPRICLESTSSCMVHSYQIMISIIVSEVTSQLWLFLAILSSWRWAFQYLLLVWNTGPISSSLCLSHQHSCMGDMQRQIQTRYHSYHH